MSQTRIDIDKNGVKQNLGQTNDTNVVPSDIIIFCIANDHVRSNRVKESLKLALLEIIKSTCPLFITPKDLAETIKQLEMSDTFFLDRYIKTPDNGMENELPKEEKNKHVPTILIVLNESNGSLEMIKKSLENKIPVLLIKENRRISDLLSNMLDRFKKKSLLGKKQIIEDESSWHKFCSLFISGVKTTNEIGLLRSILKIYHESVIKNKAILIETLSFETESDLPLEVLKTLYNANPIQTDESSSVLLFKILILATKWNKIEIANQIFNELVPFLNFNKWNEIEIETQIFDELAPFNNLIKEAITWNRPEILQLFFDECPNIKIDIIINNTQSICFFEKFKKNVEEDVLVAPFSVLYKQKDKNKSTSEHIHEKLEELIGVKLKKHILNSMCEKVQFNISIYDDSVIRYLVMDFSNVMDQLHEKNEVNVAGLFIWCILFNRPHIAKLILPKLKHQIAYALVASIIFKKFYEKTSLKAFLDSSEEFENLAIQITEYFDLKEDDEYNMELLYYLKIKDFGCKLMYLAYKGKCRKFVSSLTVYKTIRLMWISSDLKENKVRKTRNIQKLNSDVFDSKKLLLVLSNLSYGLLAPFLLYKKNELQYSTSTQSIPIKNDESEKQKETFSEVKNKKNELPYFTSTQSIPIKNDESEKQNETFSEQNEKSFTYLEKYKDFVYSPQILFTYDAIIHFMFLLTFSYWLLSGSFFQAKASNSFTNQTSDPNLILTTYNQSNVSVENIWVENLIMTWAFLYFFQIIREIYILKKENIWNKWNNINCLGSLLFFLGILVKNMSREDEIREISRLILCIDLLVWYIRSFGIFMGFRTLGPKLIMIRKMMWDILSFITIVFVFLLAYGVTIQAMMRLENLNHRTKSQNLFDISYWPIFGEITFLKEIQENVQLSKYASYYGYIATAIYMFIANVLLLNLLIAMFNNTFNSIEQNATEIWKYQYFKVVYEYHLCAKYRLLPLPSIFTLIDFCTIGLRSIYYFFMRCFKLIGRMNKRTGEQENEQEQENEHKSSKYSEMSIIFSNDSIISSATSKKSDENEVLDSNAKKVEKTIIEKEKNYSKIVLKSQKTTESHSNINRRIEKETKKIKIKQDNLEDICERLDNKLDNIIRLLNTKGNLTAMR